MANDLRKQMKGIADVINQTERYRAEIENGVWKVRDQDGHFILSMAYAPKDNRAVKNTKALIKRELGIDTDAKPLRVRVRTPLAPLPAVEPAPAPAEEAPDPIIAELEAIVAEHVGPRRETAPAAPPARRRSGRGPNRPERIKQAMILRKRVSDALEHMGGDSNENRVLFLRTGWDLAINSNDQNYASIDSARKALNHLLTGERAAMLTWATRWFTRAADHILHDSQEVRSRKVRDRITPVLERHSLSRSDFIRIAMEMSAKEDPKAWNFKNFNSGQASMHTFFHRGTASPEALDVWERALTFLEANDPEPSEPAIGISVFAEPEPEDQPTLTETQLLKQEVQRLQQKNISAQQTLKQRDERIAELEGTLNRLEDRLAESAATGGGITLNGATADGMAMHLRVLRMGIQNAMYAPEEERERRVDEAFRVASEVAGLESR